MRIDMMIRMTNSFFWKVCQSHFPALTRQPDSSSLELCSAAIVNSRNRFEASGHRKRLDNRRIGGVFGSSFDFCEISDRSERRNSVVDLLIGGINLSILFSVRHLPDAIIIGFSSKYKPFDRDRCGFGRSGVCTGLQAPVSSHMVPSLFAIALIFQNWVFVCMRLFSAHFPAGLKM
jgi:hypothetical protein